MTEMMLTVRVSRSQLGAALVCVWLWIAERTCWRARNDIRRASLDYAGGVAHGQTQPEAALSCPDLCLTVPFGERTPEAGGKRDESELHIG